MPNEANDLSDFFKNSGSKTTKLKVLEPAKVPGESIKGKKLTLMILIVIVLFFIIIFISINLNAEKKIKVSPQVIESMKQSAQKAIPIHR